MWDMAQSSIKLFFRGKLFAEPGKVMTQLGVGIAATVVVLVLLAEVGAPFWFAALVAGFAGGVLQPYLFKDLRYR